MAVDTRDKRASAFAGFLSVLVIPAVPDGTIDALDRQQATAVYRGIAAGEPSIPAEAVPSWTVQGLIDPGPEIIAAPIDAQPIIVRARMRRVS